MKETVPHRLSDVQAGSGSALATACASTSPQCVTTLLTVPMGLTSLLSAVSLISAFLVSLERVLCLSERLDCFIKFLGLLGSQFNKCFISHDKQDQTLK